MFIIQKQIKSVQWFNVKNTTNNKWRTHFILSYERANYEHFYTTEDDRMHNWGKESWDEAKRQTKWCADGDRFVKNTDTISVYIKNCRKDSQMALIHRQDPNSTHVYTNSLHFSLVRLLH